MGFLDKAKGALKELETQLDKAQKAAKDSGISNPEIGKLASYQKNLKVVNKGAEKLGGGHAKAETPSSSTPNTAMQTPASSVAPKTTSVKLPLAIRKEVRDDWDAKIPELEATLSQVLGVAWTIEIDAGAMYLYALETDNMGTAAKTRPGYVLYTYIEKTITNLKEYIVKFGDDGLQELNTVASAHVITMAEATAPTHSYAGCDIHEGALRILFGKTYFGTNIDQATNISNLPVAINEAGKAGGSSETSLDFDARTGMKNDYDPKIANLKAQFEKILAIDSITLDPSFEANYNKLLGIEKQSDLPRNWQKHLGAHTFMYFEALAKSLEDEGFATDDMMQEGLQDVMEKMEIKFEIVDALQKGTYSETLPEDGVLYIRTVPKYYTSNIRDVGKGLVALL
ncbi:hypothetical protein B7494_g2927 [Chlorociboria aeruginascens]|nr:hypothetical protein B7494_g2927 [Chlorociboria aeruginascens]